MKRITFIIMLITICMAKNDMTAQERHSILDGNPEWIYYSYHSGFVQSQDFGFYKYYLDGDTAMADGNTYKIMRLDIYDGNGVRQDITEVNIWHYFVNKSPFIVAYLREEGNRLYGWYLAQRDSMFIEGNKKDSFIYDFSLQQGDVVMVKYIYLGRIDRKKVLNRSSVTLADGTSRDKLTVYYCDSVYTYANPWRELPGYHNLEIIDGIGCVNGQGQLLGYNTVLDDRILWPMERAYSSHLNLFKQYGKIVYIAPEHDPNAPVDEKYTTFKKMPFYPDITPTSIKQLVAEKEFDGSSGTFNVQGRKLSAPQKGINIIDGKKILVK